MEKKSDDELLAMFVTATGNREEAFAELVRRHSPVVLGACRRILGPSSDADDAAQAVFLTLAEKAKSLGQVRSLAGWLYEVAVRLAQNVRRGAVRREIRERQAVAVNQRARDNVNDMDDLRDALDEGLAGVPEKYRLPLILHHFEGKSPEETGKILGCTAEAAAMRLTRGRGMLREKLLKRGVIVSALFLSTQLSAEAAVAVPADFVSSTAKLAAGGAGAAGAISASVLAMLEYARSVVFWNSVKGMAPIAVLLGTALIAASPFLLQGTGSVSPQPTANTQPENQTATPNPAPAPDPVATADNPGRHLDDLTIWKRFGTLPLRVSPHEVEFDIINQDEKNWDITGIIYTESYDLTRCTVTVKLTHEAGVNPEYMFLDVCIVPKVEFDDEQKSLDLALVNTVKRRGTITPLAPEPISTQTEEYEISRTEVRKIEKGKVVETSVLDKPVDHVYIALRAGARGITEPQTFRIRDVTLTRNALGKPHKEF